MRCAWRSFGRRARTPWTPAAPGRWISRRSRARAARGSPQARARSPRARASARTLARAPSSARLLLVVVASEDVGLLERQKRLEAHLLGDRRDEAVVDDLHTVDLAVHVGRGQAVGDRAGVGERGTVGEPGPGGARLEPAERAARTRRGARMAYQSTSLPSPRSSAARRLPARMICELKGPASPRSPVTSRIPTTFGSSRSWRIGMFGMFAAASDGPPRHPPERVRVGTQRLDPLLGATQPRGGHHLHRARDLADVLDRRDAAPDVLQVGHRL